MDDYKIIQADTLSSLERMVNRALLDNYFPVGGLSVISSSRKIPASASIFSTHCK